jgi:riboflavin biosynthesis pyrimidine reductase
LPVPWILEALQRRGVETLLVEAGGDLLFQFLAKDALDELYVTLCPLVIGGETPSLADGHGFLRSEMRRLKLLSAEVEEDEIFLRYSVRR